MKCFYHSADLDGHCSGAIVKYRYPECEMYPINYGDEFPFSDVREEEIVYMVDFCLQPFHQMVDLAESGATVVWIDHHKSAIEEYNKWYHNTKTDAMKYLLFEGMRDTTKAACELTWEYLFPDKPVPLAVKLLSLYDSWTYQGHELEDMVLPFQMRMRMEDLDPKNWEDCGDKWSNLFGPPEGFISEDGEMIRVSDLIEEGRLILRYDEEQKRRYVQTYGFETRLGAFPYEQLVWGGDAKQTMYGKYYKAIAVNLGHTNSKVFDSVWQKECEDCCGIGIFEDGNFGDAYEKVTCHVCNGTGHIEPYDLMITFCRRKDKLWNVSLYSTKPDIDCGAIAKSFGGGGHKGAAGFRCEKLPFNY